nr:ABC transporter B family member 19 [Tanacetum cinerariifolium]
YALYFVYLDLVVCVSSYAEIGCWMYTGERQVSPLRKKYLEAVLKQDVGFYDTDARTGDIVFSVSTDTLLVQDAISEKHLLKLIFRAETIVKLPAMRVVGGGSWLGEGERKYDLCPSFIEDLTAKGVGLRLANSHTGNHHEDGFTPLETIRSFLGMIGSRYHSSSKRRPRARGEEMAFRNFMYAETNEDLSFLPKEPSPDFSTGSPLPRSTRSLPLVMRSLWYNDWLL